MSARAFKVGSTVATGKETVTVSYDGDLFLEHAEAGEKLTLTSGGEVCHLAVPSPLPSLEQIATLRCE
jgi:outer membrane usher protein FimD/PapC